jgi:hypothetical protein
MITYKRKRVTSRRNTTDETVHDSPPAASNNVVASSLPPKYEANGNNKVNDEDSFVSNLGLFPSLLMLLFDAISVTCDCLTVVRTIELAVPYIWLHIKI